MSPPNQCHLSTSSYSGSETISISSPPANSTYQYRLFKFSCNSIPKECRHQYFKFLYLPLLLSSHLYPDPSDNRTLLSECIYELKVKNNNICLNRSNTLLYSTLHKARERNPQNLAASYLLRPLSAHVHPPARTPRPRVPVHLSHALSPVVLGLEPVFGCLRRCQGGHVFSGMLSSNVDGAYYDHPNSGCRLSI
jgi:hypothetical protein